MTTSAHTKLGELGARRRSELGLSSLDLALTAGVSAEAVTNFEHGYGCAPADMRLIEKGLSWRRGVVELVIAKVQAGQLSPSQITMEHLDAEDSRL